METKTAPSPRDADQQQTPAPRFVDASEPRRVPPGQQTDEEARLAAEIEKLRG